MDNDDVAHRVRRLREARGWTQARLAQEAGLAQAQVSRIESGENAPGLPVAVRLASALGVDLNTLAGYRAGAAPPAEPEHPDDRLVLAHELVRIARRLRRPRTHPDRDGYSSTDSNNLKALLRDAVHALAGAAI